MTYLGDGRFLPAGTILVCPVCGEKQATLSCDIFPDRTWDFRAITPIDRDGIIGVSTCHEARYVTFDGLFYTESGPY